jgi:hypothetical protein
MKQTLIQQQQQKAQTLKQRICEMLHWDDEDFAGFQYEMGLAYLAEYIPNDVQGADQLARSKTFWNWWKNTWQQRDEAFIEMVKPHWKYEDIVYIYLDEHNPSILISTTHPNAVVLNQSYAEMIQKVIDEVNQTV